MSLSSVFARKMARVRELTARKDGNDLAGLKVGEADAALDQEEWGFEEWDRRLPVQPQKGWGSQGASIPLRMSRPKASLPLPTLPSSFGGD
jgi:hypothetical protein